MTKENRVSDIKAILPHAFLADVEGYSQYLFADRDVTFDNEAIEADIAFLKNTSLSELDYSINLKPDSLIIDSFTLDNHKTGQSITVSDAQEGGSLKWGFILRQLKAGKENQPAESAYDAMNQLIRSPVHSSVIASLKRSFTQGDDAMSEDHFNLFTALLHAKINDKITPQTIPGTEASKDAKERFAQHLWEGIDVAAIYDASESIVANLKRIDSMSTDLKNRGHQEASDVVHHLSIDLDQEKTALIQGKSSIQNFAQNCEAFIENAAKDLGEHRGFLSKLWNAITKSLGLLVQPKPTNSIQKTTEMKNSLKEMLQASQSRTPEPVNEPAARLDKGH